MSITLTDLFCGAGGSSTGAVQIPGISVRVASNHWQLAVDTHNTNHPDADHICADLTQIDPRYFPTTDILWASPECTNHSIAKGKKRSTNQLDLFGDGLPDEAAQRSRATMWDVPRFTEVHEYQAVIVENVVEAANWVPFQAWLMAMDSLGYHHQIVWLNSMHAWALGAPAPQSRDRMYVVFWRKGNRKPDLERMQRPPAWCPTHGRVEAMQAFKNPAKRWGRYRAQYVYRCPQVECRNRIVEPAWIPAASIIDWSDTGTRIGDRTRPLAEKTIRRIQAGIDRYWTAATVDPLLVNHVSGADVSRSSTVHEVAPTMVAGGLHASLLVPVEGREGKAAASVTGPIRTMTTRNETGLLVPAGGSWNETAYSVTEAARTRTTRESEGVAFPPMVHLEAAGNTYDAADPSHPAHGREGGYYRVWDGTEPFKTMHTTASKGVAFPPFIAELRGGGSDARPSSDALSTVTASGNHHALIVRNFGQPAGGEAHLSTPVHEPTRTITTAGHQSLVTRGQTIEVEDCHFRMLTPSEIQQAMAFEKSYVLLGSKREKVRMAGNAVTPPTARDLVGCVAESLEVAA
ncbi:DNA cytosine methyltransferase [Kocuria sp.]|uniref:DNA cytosine methyltransferase n=1 Tax=Kocuria sp. TaxID=1871328 RepID=UPI0026E0A43C|nr:DNA cytosine methyltransferase [Kocuria sp.]MDO5619299.1 DNA cytosine methyltransferase [Kocuria sp.]